jgi:hypothetical protein
MNGLAKADALQVRSLLREDHGDIVSLKRRRLRIPFGTRMTVKGIAVLVWLQSVRTPGEDSPIAMMPFGIFCAALR